MKWVNKEGGYWGFLLLNFLVFLGDKGRNRSWERRKYKLRDSQQKIKSRGSGFIHGSSIWLYYFLIIYEFNIFIIINARDTQAPQGYFYFIIFFKKRKRVFDNI